MLKSDPQRDPKGDPKPLNSRMSDLAKRMAFTERITHFAVLDVLWDPFLFHTVLRTLFFHNFPDF